jgi:hypothetical protein
VLSWWEFVLSVGKRGLFFLLLQCAFLSFLKINSTILWFVSHLGTKIFCPLIFKEEIIITDLYSQKLTNISHLSDWQSILLFNAESSGNTIWLHIIKERWNQARLSVFPSGLL